MTVAGEESGMRRLRNCVFCIPDIFIMQYPIELKALVVWYLVAEGVVTTIGDDESAQERLDRNNTVSCALGIFSRI